jgi:chaperonin GroES
VPHARRRAFVSARIHPGQLNIDKTLNGPSIQNPNHMAKAKIKPIGDRVLVRHIEEKEQVRGGMIIPDSAKEKPQEAEVIALGTGKKDDDGKAQPFEVKVGDRVLISKYGGTEVKLDEEKYTLVREDDILGVIA